LSKCSNYLKKNTIFLSTRRRDFRTQNNHVASIFWNKAMTKHILFWKSALIMASRYPRERDEVDRKKRRAADTIHFLFP
jgi:hypothetical protein